MCQSLFKLKGAANSLAERVVHCLVCMSSPIFNILLGHDVYFVYSC